MARAVSDKREQNKGPYRRVHLLVGGRVQGVFFRESTKERARELQVTGWVRNLADGRVEVVAEGPESWLNEFVRYCERGPSNARVTTVQVDWDDFIGEFEDFSVLRG